MYKGQCTRHRGAEEEDVDELPEKINGEVACGKERQRGSPIRRYPKPGTSKITVIPAHFYIKGHKQIPKHCMTVLLIIKGGK